MPQRRTALVLIDVQKGFESPAWGPRHDPGLAPNLTRLLAAFRDRGAPVVHVLHLSHDPASPLRPERGGEAPMDFAAPREGERVFTKHVNSAFIGTPLEGWLRGEGISAIVLAGLTSDHCVSTTARMGANLGFEVSVVADATVAFERQVPDGRRFPAELVHDVSLASLDGEFARVVTTNALLDRPL